MTTWTTITDGQTGSEAPITQALMRALRDNISALAEGSAGAPFINRAAISPGSSGADGAVGNGTTVTGSGFFEFASILLSAPKTFPDVVIARVNGDVTISDTLSMGTLSDAEYAQVDLLGVLRGNYGATGNTSGGNNPGGGGGNYGAGGNGNHATSTGGAARSHSNLRWPWLHGRPRCGGYGGAAAGGGGGLGGGGGGGLILIANGNVNVTGGTIDASGAAGTEAGSNGGGGGGAGGSIIIITPGTITAGTYKANGGAAPAPSGGGLRGGGGGGGYIALVASAFAGSRTKETTGGAGFNNGGAGSSEEITLTAAQINSILLRSF